MLLSIAGGVTAFWLLCHTNTVDVWQPLYSTSRNVCRIVAWSSLLGAHIGLLETQFKAVLSVRLSADD